MLKNLRAKRVEMALSQEDLAKLAHLRQTYISQLERGLMPRSQSDVARLADVLGVSESVLIGDEEHAC